MSPDRYANWQAVLRVERGGQAMLVSIGLEDSLSVQIEIEGGYQPDLLDDACSRARDLFRLALADLRHDQAEHE